MSATIIAEGKTKIIVDANGDVTSGYGDCPSCPKVLIVSKDDITAGDGEFRESLSGKAQSANKTTINVFKLLKEHGIPTHFLSPFDDRSFLALRAEMIPLEVVTRRIATGSYLKRHPEVQEGQRFRMVEYELFHKDDINHDPFVVWHADGWRIDRYKADQPLSQQSKIDTVDFEPDWMLFEVDLDQMRIIALQVFLILEEAWQKLEVVLYDMKIEFGLVDDGKGGKRLVVADVITNDEWRIRDRDGNQLDKQVFRDAVKDSGIIGLTEGELERIGSNYDLVAKLTRQFVTRSHCA